MKYDIIKTGSKGNALVIDEVVLIDCGVSFKALKNYYKSLKIVLLTHEHSDHLNKATIKKLAQERPNLRFGVPKWLLEKVIDCGVELFNIDVYVENTVNSYLALNLKVEMFHLAHNVPNCGYKVIIDDIKIIYATDTNKIDHIEAKGFNYYFIEANYSENGIIERIKEKQSIGEYCYEYDVINNHLSIEKAKNWLYSNIDNNSVYIYMHANESEDIYDK